ncbi:MAG: class I SAM-dependent methyltransferase [Rhizobiaceae bacterium]
MQDDPHIETLSYPFEAGLLPWPEKSRRVVCFDLAEPFAVLERSGAAVTHVQGFRPSYLKLERAGCAVVATAPHSTEFDWAFVRLGRHRGRNEAWIAAALRAVKPGGYVVAAGGKTDGAASLRKRVAGLGADIDHAARNHGVVFWLDVGDDRAELADRLEPAPAARVDGRFRTAPGMFSHGRVDPGSRLLARHFAGLDVESAADFCAGWGYLSARLLAECSGLRRLHLYEADHASLEAARANVAATGQCAPQFHWHDLLGEPVEGGHDLIVMNPPFHTGRKAEPDIGREMIETAATALAPRGRLLMVANRQLPYESVLAVRFPTHRLLAEEGGFKVFAAIR